MARGDIYTLDELRGMSSQPGVPSTPTSFGGGEIQPGDTPLTIETAQESATPFTQPEDKRGFLGKARDFATSIIGGGELARGAGLAIAAPGIQRKLTEQEQIASDIDLELIKLIGEAQKEGRDTTKLVETRDKHLAQMRQTRGIQEDFVESLPSNREVIGSAVRLAATVAAPSIVKGVTPGLLPGSAGVLGVVSPLTPAVTSVGTGIVRGATVGAVSGVIEGGIQGLGLGIENEEDLAGVGETALKGAIYGGVGGAILGGIIGGVQGKIAAGKQPKNILQAVTPDGKELTPSQYDELVKSGRVTPRTATQPPQYVMSEGEKSAAMKYMDVIDDDPIKTAQNISETIGKLDDNVDEFLRTNNGIYNDGELRNALTEALDGVDDLTVSPERIAAKKEMIINNFIDDLDKNDMHTLWKARKAFDKAQNIDKAFQGTPTLNKNMKIAFRNAIQNFIADGTKDQAYKGFMYDMSNLYNLQDTVAVKATRARGVSGLQAWAKNNPLKAGALKYGTLGWIANEVLWD